MNLSWEILPAYFKDNLTLSLKVVIPPDKIWGQLDFVLKSYRTTRQTFGTKGHCPKKVLGTMLDYLTKILCSNKSLFSQSVQDAKYCYQIILSHSTHVLPTCLYSKHTNIIWLLKSNMIISCTNCGGKIPRQSYLPITSKCL